MGEVMDDLMNRNIMVRDEMIFYGDFEMFKYRMGPALTKKKCRLTNLGLKDQWTMDELFPLGNR